MEQRPLHDVLVAVRGRQLTRSRTQAGEPAIPAGRPALGAGKRRLGKIGTSGRVDPCDGVLVIGAETGAGQQIGGGGVASDRADPAHLAPGARLDRHGNLLSRGAGRRHAQPHLFDARRSPRVRPSLSLV